MLFQQDIIFIWNLYSFVIPVGDVGILKNWSQILSKNI